MKENTHARLTKTALAILLVIVLGVTAFLLMDYQFKPVIITMSEAKVRILAIQAMNSAVLEIINGNTQYSDLVDISYAKDGSIALIQADTVKMNELGNRAALIAQDKLAVVGMQDLDIPLGTLIGGQLLAGKGPLIHIKMLPMGSVTSEFKTEFESAGINQTRQKIYIVLSATVRIVTPTGSHPVEVSSQMPVSETIIVGNVPNTFINVDDSNQALPLIPK